MEEGRRGFAILPIACGLQLRFIFGPYSDEDLGSGCGPRAREDYAYTFEKSGVQP